MLVNPGAAAIITGSRQVQAVDVLLRNVSFANRPLRSLGLPPSLLIVSVIRRVKKSHRLVIRCYGPGTV